MTKNLKSEKELAYTEDEIVSLYRAASKKKRQIQILADLADTDVQRIVRILKRHGEFK